MAQQRTVADALNDLWQKGIKPADDLRAPIESPQLTGTPTAPTPDITDDSDRIATTAYCLQLWQNLVDSAPETLNTLGELAAALKNNPNVITELTNLIGQKLDSTTAANTYLTQSSASSTYFPKTFRNATAEIYGTDFRAWLGCNVVLANSSAFEISTHEGVNTYGTWQGNIKSAITLSNTGKITISGTELYFNGTKLA